MKEITITVDDGHKVITFKVPCDLRLMPNDEGWDSWQKIFETILYSASFHPDSIRQMFPDCELCDTIEELNREHNAELVERCERCEYKQKEPPIITPIEEKETVRCCGTCKHEKTPTMCGPCCDCKMWIDEDTFYTNWQPKP